MLEHLAIRRGEFVGGTVKRPEMSILVQANRNSLNWLSESLAAGQAVWLKWAGGPVVARAEVKDWAVGAVPPEGIESLRAETLGTELHEKAAFWADLRERVPLNYVLIRLVDDVRLPRALRGPRRSYGSSWFLTRRPEEKAAWLGAPM